MILNDRADIILLQVPLAKSICLSGTQSLYGTRGSSGQGSLIENDFIRDLFHVYLNRCEFHFLRLHINKTNLFCFIIDNGRVSTMVKQTKWQFKA